MTPRELADSIEQDAMPAWRQHADALGWPGMIATHFPLIVAALRLAETFEGHSMDASIAALDAYRIIRGGV